MEKEELRHELRQMSMKKVGEQLQESSMENSAKRCDLHTSSHRCEGVVRTHYTTHTRGRAGKNISFDGRHNVDFCSALT